MANYPAPKRNVRRVVRQIETDFANSEVITGLYTAGEKETLVRTIIEAVWLQNPGGNAVSMAGSLDIQRAGQDFDDALTEGNISAYEPGLQNLWVGQTQFKVRDSGETVGEREIHVDMKSMRKLATGDAIDLRVIGNYPTDSGTISGVITFFFKEA